MILIKNDRPDFKSLFQDFLLTESTFSYGDEYSFYNGISNYFDDDYDYDSLCDYYSKKNKRGKRGKSKKSKSKRKVGSIYDNDDLFKDDYKLIYFYEDMDNPDDNVHIFYDVYEFDNFLNEKGINVKSEKDTLFILNNDVIHSCVDPSSRESGELKLLCENSYGSLRWEYASSDDEIIKQYS